MCSRFFRSPNAIGQDRQAGEPYRGPFVRQFLIQIGPYRSRLRLSRCYPIDVFLSLKTNSAEETEQDRHADPSRRVLALNLRTMIAGGENQQFWVTDGVTLSMSGFSSFCCCVVLGEESPRTLHRSLKLFGFDSKVE